MIIMVARLEVAGAGGGVVRGRVPPPLPGPLRVTEGGACLEAPMTVVNYRKCQLNDL